MFGKFDDKLPVMSFHSIKFYAKRRAGSYGLPSQERDFFAKDKEGYFVPQGMVVNGSSRSRQFMVTWSNKSFLAGIIGATCVHRQVKQTIKQCLI